MVDSDYQLSRDFLRRCAPLFAEPWVGFTQAPQDYRGWEHARYYRRLYYSYAYFFAVSQPSRNERDGAIFAGTMGLIRRVALEQLGGWDEWCITEDAELSLRLLRAGWTGRHVDQSFGKGIMPLTFEALKGQRYRWCFGGIQILRMHWRSLLPGRVSRENQLTTGQRWAYLSGAVQWYGDLLGLVFLVFLLAGAVNLATGGGELFRKLTAFLVATVPVLVLLGLVRAVALLRRGTGASWRDAIGAFFIWQSTSAGRGAGLGARPVREEGSVPAHAEDQREGEMVGGAPVELGRVVAGAARDAGHRGRADQAHRAGRAAAGGPAAVPDARHGRGAVQQLGRAARGPAAGPAGAAHHGVEAQPATPGLRARSSGRRAGHRFRRDHRGPGAAPDAGPSPGADAEPGRTQSAHAHGDPDALADHAATPSPSPSSSSPTPTPTPTTPSPTPSPTPTPTPTPAPTTPSPTSSATASP